MKRAARAPSASVVADNASQVALDLSGALNALEAIRELPFEQQVETINTFREKLHEISPFASEPVDFVRWVPLEKVQGNDYNPNSVAPPEMELLHISISADGYTQPIVANLEDKKYVVVDGFHRNRVARECLDVRERIKGYLPVVQIRESRADRTDRMASTIRHNRARGKHSVEAMSDIVIELKRRNWSNERICENLGMELDEVLRLCQITGLIELFSDQQFSRAWDVEGHISESDFTDLTDDVTTYEEDQTELFRVPNTSDDTRIFHTFDKWECHKAGFFATSKNGLSKEKAQRQYADFLADLPAFEAALSGLIVDWKHSCEQNLTNASMNRIAWLGQAAACYARGLPAVFCGGFSMLTKEQQEAANEMALKYLNIWMERNGLPTLTMDEAYTSRQADIY